ncbi:hypothetical protein KIH79_11465 [Bifidobacterium sp. 82T10]|uniref:Uncharacterized protein n=1 Tax=Bifidobacterium miconis TaxID=2834435 RepID=A0ABS6WHJ7_9BIFI|nr:hypothetical protein [Bifidobacterium miconis]MBW3093526.1 hypothetical protein [Bifidobacterium miconis]
MESASPVPASVPWLVSRIGVHGKSWVTVLSFALAVVRQVGFLIAGSSPGFNAIGKLRSDPCGRSAGRAS